MNGSKISPESARLSRNLVRPNNTPRTLKWTNLSYRITRTFNPASCFQSDNNDHQEAAMKLDEKQSRLAERSILNSLSGNISEGSLAAILGPSGSGKSTLIECLFGKRRKGLTGEINYIGFQDQECVLKNEVASDCPASRTGTAPTSFDGNHEAPTSPIIDPARSSNSICFIAQEDHLFDKLTVRETLMFAYHVKNVDCKVSEKCVPCEAVKDLRSNLPRDLSVNMPPHAPVRADVVVIHKVSSVLSQLWLDTCADVMVGNCSGGQRKRISIACELVSDPLFLFLDEPTSGLDSSTALQCLLMLKGLTGSKRVYPASNLTILLSIHQPSSRILELFDQLYILSREGTNIYFGPPSELVSYLSSFNLHCPKFHNPADFVIEIASSADATNLIDSRRPAVHLSSAASKTFKSNRPKIKSNMSPGILFRHLKLILKRHVKITIREPLLTSMRLLVHVVVGVAVSLLYGSEPGRASGCNSINQYGTEHLLDQKTMIHTSMNMTLMFFTLFFLTFTSLTPTILTFPSELNVFMKENCNGWYSSAVYFAAITIIDVPMTIIFPTAFLLIVYPMTGQQMEPDRFLLFILVSCLVSFVSQSVGVLISIIFAGSLKVIVFLAPVTLTPAFLFSGFFVRQSFTPSYLKPLHYASYVKYSLDSFINIVYGLDRCKALGMRRAALSQSGSEDERRIFVSDEAGMALNDSFLSSSGDDSIPIDLVNASVTSAYDSNVTDHANTSATDTADEMQMFTSAQYHGFNQRYFSYVMKEFSLSESESAEQIRDSCFVLLGIIILLRILSFLILLRKTHSK